MELFWLPKATDWNASLRTARNAPAPEAAAQLVALANHQLDFVQTAKLDRVVLQFGEALHPHLDRTPALRLAMIGSSTLAHLVPAIRVSALRRGFRVDVFEGHYGVYMQELAARGSELHAFKPDVVLLALDAHHIASSEGANTETALATMRSCWRLITEELHAVVLQQTVLPVFPPLLGNNEHEMTNSPAHLIADLNQQLRPAAREAGVRLLAVDHLAEKWGTRSLFDPALWHRSKQEIHPTAAPLWGDHVGRILGAVRGLSSKCLVLDLDNTLWGGVVGDDGIEGILLGQGNAVGEAYVAFQRFALSLANRGIILAVCSKNEDATARAVFEQHPEMVLRMKDLACFVANWDDKAANLRAIAKSLNIGLDSIVFADDNPFERNLVRQELPMVAVPELPEDSALYAETIAEGGYFEAIGLTHEDRERVSNYRANSEREQLRESVTDMASYLRDLEMRLVWSPFDGIGLPRITQLINKSNQFNLTTRRYTQTEVAELMADPQVITLQLRLIDRFGDNGMVVVIIGRMREEASLELDTWLMSCRVLGRQVEEETLNLIVEQARNAGVKQLRGVFTPTAKNAMVREHYAKLGFSLVDTATDQSTAWSLNVSSYQQKHTHIRLVEGSH